LTGVNALLPQVGFDMSLGGAIAHLSRSDAPEFNMVNEWDPGRLVQMTFYGSRDNSTWVQWGQRVKWRYNAVQVGGLSGSAARWQAATPACELQQRWLLRACRWRVHHGQPNPTWCRCPLPAQGGSYDLQPGSVLERSVNATSRCFSSRSMPRHWATGQLLEEMQMQQTVCLEGRMVTMSMSMKYSGGLAAGVAA
jgi:hypothetical protein